jgi:SAM-dependent methyltransferase
MPFPDDSFDVVWMQNVGMNIDDKRKLYEEMQRVLKPNGRFAFQEMIAGKLPAAYFPLPWATEQAEQFLISFDQMSDLLLQTGFEQAYFEDVSHTPLPEMDSPSLEGKKQAPLSLSAYVDNLAQKADNALRSIDEDRVRLVRGLFRAKK